MKHSSVWRKIAEGFMEFFKQCPSTSYRVFSVIENYNNTEEYLKKVSESIGENPDALVLPLTPKQDDSERRLLTMLEQYKGMVIAVNVPPDENAKSRLKGKLRGYVGMNEVAAGRLAADRLFSHTSDFDCIYIPVDKPDHFGYSLRIQGIKEVSGVLKIPVCKIDINDQKKSAAVCQLMGSGAFISLGPVGTDFALEAQKRYPKKVSGIVAIDLDQKTAEAIKANKIICALIQHPREQGAKAAELAVNLLTKKITSAYTEIYCGPTVVDTNNISIFE